jgi:hypothetical protein
MILLQLDVRSWHFSAVPTAPSNVGYRGKIGKHLLGVFSS